MGITSCLLHLLCTSALCMWLYIVVIEVCIQIFWQVFLCTRALVEIAQLMWNSGCLCTNCEICMLDQSACAHCMMRLKSLNTESVVSANCRCFVCVLYHIWAFLINQVSHIQMITYTVKDALIAPKRYMAHCRCSCNPGMLYNIW